MPRSFHVSFLLLILVIASAACAAKPTWEPIGLSGAGGIFCPAISPVDSNLAMLHCDMSEVYLTHDGGATWKMVHTAELRSNTRCRGAFHPADPKIIYSPHNSSTLKVSRDGGEHWEELATFDGALEGALVLWPLHPEVMIVGVKDTVRMSRDGGRTWAICKDVQGTFIGAHFSQNGSYLAIHVATSKGIWRSTDVGTTWMNFNEGLPAGAAIRGFTGANKLEATLYCTVESREQDGKYVGGIYRYRMSNKQGVKAVWESAMGSGLNMEMKAFDQWAKDSVAQYYDIATSDAKPDTVWVSSGNTGIPPPHHASIYRSDDGGRTWRATFQGDPRYPGRNVEMEYMTTEDGQFYQHVGAIALDPRNPDHVLDLDASWCYFTTDGGKTWKSGNAIPLTPPAHNSAWKNNGLMLTTTWNYYIDPHEKQRHYICYTDIGFARSLDAGKTWLWWGQKDSSPWRNTCYELAIDPDRPGKIFGAFSNMHDIPNGNIIYGKHGGPATNVGGICVSDNFADTWKVLQGGLPVKPATSIVMDPKSPKDSRTLYAAFFNAGIYKSTDDGKTWTAKNNGLGDPTNMRVYRVTLHPDGTLFAVITALTKDGKFLERGVGLYRSQNGGDSWQCISKTAPALWPKDFTVDPGDSRIIYLGLADANGQKIGGLYRTTDGGATWNLLTRQGPQHFGAYLHPKHPGWIYATLTESAPTYGLYLSKDNGKTFAPLTGMPFDNAQRVAFDPSDDSVIYVTTFGGSVWRGPSD